MVSAWRLCVSFFTGWVLLCSLIWNSLWAILSHIAKRVKTKRWLSISQFCKDCCTRDWCARLMWWQLWVLWAMNHSQNSFRACLVRVFSMISCLSFSTTLWKACLRLPSLLHRRSLLLASSLCWLWFHSDWVLPSALLLALHSSTSHSWESTLLLRLLSCFPSQWFPTSFQKVSLLLTHKCLVSHHCWRAVLCSPTTLTTTCHRKAKLVRSLSSVLWARLPRQQFTRTSELHSLTLSPNGGLLALLAVSSSWLLWAGVLQCSWSSTCSDVALQRALSMSTSSFSLLMLVWFAALLHSLLSSLFPTRWRTEHVLQLRFLLLIASHTKCIKCLWIQPWLWWCWPHSFSVPLWQLFRRLSSHHLRRMTLKSLATTAQNQLLKIKQRWELSLFTKRCNTPTKR